MLITALVFMYVTRAELTRRRSCRPIIIPLFELALELNKKRFALIPARIWKNIVPQSGRYPI